MIILCYYIVNVGATAEPSSSSSTLIKTPSTPTTYSPIIPTLPSSTTPHLPDGPTSHSTIVSATTDESSNYETNDAEITILETSETESTTSNETEANNATSTPITIITTSSEIEDFIWLIRSSSFLFKYFE